jgi:hypothetical protein
MYDYEAERAAQQAERDQRRNAMHALMASVGVELAKLGDPARFEPRLDGDGVPLESGDLVFADGLEVHASLYRDGYHAGAKYRVRFSPNVPREADGSNRTLRDYGLVEGKSPEISVQYEATPERIAKDIRRRLLADFDVRAKMAKVAERQASRKRYQDGQRALALELFELADQKPRPDDFGRDRYATIRLYEFAPGVSYGDLQVRGDDSVHLEVNVSGEVAKAFLEMLKARRAGAEVQS